MTPPPRQTGPTRRQGFTLVELLVVILILAILISLLVPVIAAAVRSANNARVAAEINNMATALASFKERYGEYPPSRIILYENPVWYGAGAMGQLVAPTAPYTDITLGDLKTRTLRAMKKFFPRSSHFGRVSKVDWNDDGVFGDTESSFVILQGNECLVFFLGGMPDVTAGTSSYSVTGFGKDPVNPFTRPAQGGNRTPPLFEFATSRLQDVISVNGFPSYLDPLSSINAPRPYVYFSSYGNNGYDPNDDNSMSSIEAFDDNSVVTRTFYVSFPVVPLTAAELNIARSPVPNPYTGGASDARAVSPSTPQRLSWLNPQSFQLMSCGLDGEWGMGGAFDANGSGGKLPLFGSDPSNPFAEVPNPRFAPTRARERDNITNFQSGKLD